MKKVTRISGMLLVALATSMPSLAWSQEAVNGHYDSKNDWFVFDWLNPQTGQQEAIYDSANKINPVIHAEVSFDSTGVGTYGYQVTNLKGAVQLLDDISVKHFSAVFGATSPVPPTDWYSTEYQGKGAWSWSKIGGSPRGISGGHTMSGFSFRSKGLPTIVDAWFAGKRRAQFRFPSPDDDTEEVQSSFGRVFNSLKAEYPDKFVDTVHQKTVGPAAPPASFDASAFIQNLISLKEQSLAMRWIDNAGIATSLDAKLDAAKAKIVAGDNKTAKNILGVFLNEVQAQKGKHLKPEAYALLYYNGQYLMNHL